MMARRRKNEAAADASAAADESQAPAEAKTPRKAKPRSVQFRFARAWHLDGDRHEAGAEVSVTPEVAQQLIGQRAGSIAEG